MNPGKGYPPQQQNYAHKSQPGSYPIHPSQQQHHQPAVYQQQVPLQHQAFQPQQHQQTGGYSIPQYAVGYNQYHQTTQQPTGPPPPYSSQGYPLPHQQAFVQQQPFPQSQTIYPQQTYPVYSALPQQTGAAAGSFDSSARFGKGATHNIPPPPPGYAPNNVQLASMQGRNVAINQSKQNFVEGASSGGSVFW